MVFDNQNDAYESATRQSDEHADAQQQLQNAVFAILVDTHGRPERTSKNSVQQKCSPPGEIADPVCCVGLPGPYGICS
ncbi:MAG: hypothetical protein K2X81_13165 [Candidatus Obscuribacterales bacterium]|nr:hypothetical protein [Candidatus Obscuribacterales bacterium]